MYYSCSTWLKTFMQNVFGSWEGELMVKIVFDFMIKDV